MKGLLLTEYLSDGISKREMYQVILQFVDAMIETERTDRQVVLRLDELTIQNGKVDLKYEESMKTLSILRISDFIKDIIFRCIFRIGEEVGDLSDFLRFLDNEREVTLPYIYEYVMDELDLDIPPNRRSLFEPESQAESISSNIIERERQSIPTSSNMFDSPYQNMELPRNDETGVLDVSFWEQNRALREADKIQRHSQKLRQSMQPAGRTGIQTMQSIERAGIQTMQTPGQQAARTMQSDETGLLDESFWDNKMQNITPRQTPAMMAMNKNVSLVNIKSKEEIRITKNTFVVGKDAGSCDLVISNKTISRKHAEIIIKGSRYYVKDLGSTNKTYLGNTEITPNAEMEIFDGSKIKFSNEVYEFVVR